jgi:ABC-2 type transport system ATP-binding protein
MIEISALSKRFGQHTAIASLELTIPPGEIYALLGPNGAGKSTTIACVLGFLKPDSGSVRLCGSALAPAEAAVAHAAYIPENVVLYERLSAVEIVQLFASLHGMRLTRAGVEAILQRVGLLEKAWDAQAHTYSKGMRQRVGIAIALAKKAQVLVLDEPTSGLDPLAAREFADLLRALSAEGVAVLMATHDLFNAQAVAHRCGILKAGRLIGQWPTAQLAAGELEQHYLEALHVDATDSVAT